MSKPRELWWGYVKNVIRAYPALAREAAELHGSRITPNYNATGGGCGPSRTTETNAMRQLPPKQQQRLEAVERANSALSAKQRAVRIISASGVTKGDLEQRLRQKGESPEDAQNAVRWLSDLHLLDDAETARQIVARAAARGYGAQRARQMLYEKRVPRRYWDEALEALPDQTDALTQFLADRLGAEPDEKTRRSAVSAAQRRGFTWQEISVALARLGADTED